MSGQSIDETYKKNLPDHIPLLEITTNVTNCDEFKKEQKAWEIYEEPTEQKFNSFLPELYAVTHQLNKPKNDVLELREFNEAQSVDSDCHQAVISVEKPSSTIM